MTQPVRPAKTRAIASNTLENFMEFPPFSFRAEVLPVRIVIEFYKSEQKMGQALFRLQCLHVRWVLCPYVPKDSILAKATSLLLGELDTPIPTDAFSSSDAAHAKHIPFARPDAVLPPGEGTPGEKAQVKTQ